MEDHERLMGLVVNSPLAIIRALDGKLHHFYRGAAIPSGLDKDHVDHLVAEGFLVDDSKAKEPTAPAPAEPAKPAAPESK